MLATQSSSLQEPMRLVPWPLSGRQAGQAAPLTPELRKFVPSNFSPDGTLIAGHNQGTGGDEPGGIWLYDVAARRYEQVTETGSYPSWLPDGRHLVYTREAADTLNVVDRVTRQVRDLPIELRGTFDGFSMTVTEDGSAIYIAERELEADLWMLDLGAAEAPARAGS